MLIDGAVHTEVDAETMESHSAYVDVISLADGFYYAPGTMLLVGLGGGSIAKEFALKGWIVDAVEIDPAVTRIGEKPFRPGTFRREGLSHGRARSSRRRTKPSTS